MPFGWVGFDASGADGMTVMGQWVSNAFRLGGL